MKKNIFLSVVISIGLMVPIDLKSSTLGDWVPQGIRQGLSSMYDSIPNFSQYLPSTLQWLTNLSENQKWKLFLTLGAMLGITSLYKIYSYHQSKKEDQATREEASKIYDFQDNGTNFNFIKNASNIATFIHTTQTIDKDKLSDNPLITPERLFKAFVYPVLEHISKNELSRITSQIGHENFWNNKMDEISQKGFRMYPNSQYHLKDLKKPLEQYIQNHNSAAAQKILYSMNQALKLPNRTKRKKNKKESDHIQDFKAVNRDQWDAKENLSNLANYFDKRYTKWNETQTTQKDVFDRYIYPILAANYSQRNNNPNSWIDLIEKTRKSHDLIQDPTVKNRKFVEALKDDLDQYKELNVNSHTEFTEPRLISESMGKNLNSINK